MTWQLKKNKLDLDLSKASKLEKRLSTSRRFPKHILIQELHISEQSGMKPCSAEIDGERRSISTRSQLVSLEKTLERPYRGSYLLIIGVDDVETRAQTLAGAIFLEAIKQHLANPKVHTHTPFWYTVVGGRYDALRDDSNFIQSLGKFGMLFIANVATNSTPEKLEKVRDLLSTFSHLPRVLVLAGGDPLEFARNQLYIRPNRVIYLSNRKTAVKNIQV